MTYGRPRPRRESWLGRCYHFQPVFFFYISFPPYSFLYSVCYVGIKSSFFFFFFFPPPSLSLFLIATLLLWNTSVTPSEPVREEIKKLLMRRQVLIENKSFLIEREKMKMKIKKPSTPALGIELGTSRLRTCIALYVSFLRGHQKTVEKKSN